MSSVSYEQAYVLGMMVAGGTLSESHFEISLPFEERASGAADEISQDIINEISKHFRTGFGLSIVHAMGKKSWTLASADQSEQGIRLLRSTLSGVGLPVSGTLLENADLAVVRQSLTKQEARYFLSGVYDVRASVARSHRRFSESAPIVSIEIPGKQDGFRFVVELCQWLTEMGSITDQILYNHPSFHATRDPFYAGWKKGFKIRLLARDAFERNYFGFRKFASEAELLAGEQEVEQQPPCKDRTIGNPQNRSIHHQLSSPQIPIELDSQVFLHFFHVCAVLGCPNAPISEVEKMVSEASNFVSPFPLLSKSVDESESAELKAELLRIRDLYFAESELTTEDTFVGDAPLDALRIGCQSATEAIAFLVADGDSELNGKRVRGKSAKILDNDSGSFIRLTRIASAVGGPVLLENPLTQRAALISEPGTVSSRLVLEKVLVKEGLSLRVVR